MANYDTLRRQARTLESVLEGKMAAYSRLGTNLGAHDEVELEAGVQDRWSNLEAEVEGLFEKLTETVEDMAALLNNPGSPPTQTSMPSINNLLGMIRTRRRRDAIIMGAVFGIGFVLILMYHWG
ncbi:hypothetical protein FRC15_005183 [Serendipita sp. 397]|nr:hypothetical protein FRC15_005183 [Serendipita sp. 397]KAG8791052.1 hypothetical protein FRC16_000615 [Serendipita sp. 398]